MDLAIGLPLRNREALANLLEQLYDPSSPNYRHYLTPQQFAERFGPTEQDYQALIAFARSNHFVLTGTHANRVLLDVNAEAADVERAFHLKLRIYQHPVEPRQFYSPDVEPSVDPRIPILSIAGLDDFFLPHPTGFRASFTRRTTTALSRNTTPFSAHPTPVPALDATGSGPSGTFIGSDFRAAYAPGLSLDGSGEAVGIVAFDNYYPSDISQYEDLAGLPQVLLTNVLVNGFSRTPGQNNGEVALDIEMAASMAPGLSKVIVYEGSVGNDILNRMATDNQARQLSCSWGFGAQVDPAREQIFQQFAAQGQSFFQASGDDGAYGSGPFPPADDPFVTAVGGTSLVTSRPTGAWVSESTWVGSGGGVSANYAIPSWQHGMDMSANGGSSTMRNVPDVAVLADNAIWAIVNNGEQVTAGGTSAAAPLWAGFAALVNQQAAARHQPALGFANPALYAVARGPAYSSAFHDVTGGNNTNAVHPNGFFAVTGYDLCTGWGTPAGSNLVNALLAPADALRITPDSNVVVTGPMGGRFLPSSQLYLLTNAGTGSLSWALNSTSSWVNASPSSGVLTSGAPAVSVSLQLNPAADLLLPGSYAADVWFTNLEDGFYQNRRLTLEVVTPPLIVSQPVSQSLPAGATARFAILTSTNALLSYQWQVHGTNLLDGGNVSGVGTAALSLANVTPQDNATYSVLVRNAAGFASSSGAVLTVTSSAPIIAVQPSGQTLLPGATASFSVTAFGDAPLSYQWRQNGTNVVDGGRVSGASSKTLSLSVVSPSDAKTYSVVVSNALGIRTSAEAGLNVVSLTSPELLQTSVYAFGGQTHGAHPNGLTLGSDGNLYGTTQAGGSNDSGTLFRLSPPGNVELLHSFTGTPAGERPNGDLLQAADGTWFGTTYGGGSNAFGTIFKLGTNGLLTTLFDFDHTNGVLPAAGLLQSADGTLFGSAYEGGILHYGALFRLDTKGTFSVLVPLGSTNGSFPHCKLAMGSDGALYGTTYKGGIFGKGTVFKFSPGSMLVPITCFDGTNGAFPLAGLTKASDGSLYGTTTYGGTFGFGTIFQIAPSGTFSNLFSFTSTTDGSHPRAALFQSSDGNIYGTTCDGGSFGVGTVFRMTPTGALTTIAEFDGFNGANPEAPLVEAPDNSLYGTAQRGGPNNQGVVFRLTVPSSGPQITQQPAPVTAYAGASVALSIASFGSSPLFYQWHKDGTNLSDAFNLSGSTARILDLTNLSLLNAGSYSVTVSNAFGFAHSASANLQVLISGPIITQQPTNETLFPGATALLSVGVLGNQPLFYQWQVNGTNVLDAANVSGSTTSTLTITNVTELDNGAYTLLVTNALGSLKTSAALVTVVPVSAPGTRLATLYSFTAGPDGSNPSELADGLDGYLYGTTQSGGVSGAGTVFRVGANGGFDSLFSFDRTNGAVPTAGLVLSSNGTFYGTTTGGGSNQAGTAFSITSDGSLDTLYSFRGAADGGSPAAKLVQGIDGNLYGSAKFGGAHNWGTLFQLTPAGSIKTLYSFSAGADGSAPDAALVQSPTGVFYGVTKNGGSFTNGNTFRMNPPGPLTSLYSFTGGADGFAPVGSLVLDDEGTLYGATRSNTIRGLSFYGTLFKLSSGGTFSTLYALNFTDGSYPAAGLVRGGDGNFYGTTEQGGANSFGTVFRMTPTGGVSTLVEFDGFNDGASPLTALIQGADGNLYGTTSTGGPGGHGTIFRISFTGPPQITAQPLSRVGSTGGTLVFEVAVTGQTPLAYQWLKNGTNLTDSADLRGATRRVLTLKDLTLADVGAYSVIVTNTAGAVTSTAAALTVQVSPPNFSAALVQSNGILTLSWTSAAGRAYQVQSKATLGSTIWTNAGNPIIATGATSSSSLPMGAGSQQFYRILLLP